MYSTTYQLMAVKEQKSYFYKSPISSFLTTMTESDMLNYFEMGSITIQLTSCFICFDSAALLLLN